MRGGYRTGIGRTDAEWAGLVAIVGMACRLPQASDPDRFWRLLTSGTSAITRTPAERWDPDRLTPAVAGAATQPGMTDW